MKFNISDETHNSFLQLESFLKVVSRSVSMVVASVSALTIVTSYPSFSRANIENIVPISLKETVISNKHTRRINFCVDDIVVAHYHICSWSGLRRPNLITALGGSCLDRADISLSMYLGNEKRKVISSEHSPRFQFVIDQESHILLFVVVIKIFLVWSGSSRT